MLITSLGVSRSEEFPTVLRTLFLLKTRMPLKRNALWAGGTPAQLLRMLRPTTLLSPNELAWADSSPNVRA